MLYDVEGNQARFENDEEKQQVMEFYSFLFEKLLQQQKEMYSSLEEFPITYDVCNTILKFSAQTFDSVLNILDTGVQANPLLGVKEDRTGMQQQLFEEALAYLKSNLE